MKRHFFTLLSTVFLLAGCTSAPTPTPTLPAPTDTAAVAAATPSAVTTATAAPTFTATHTARPVITPTPLPTNTPTPAPTPVVISAQSAAQVVELARLGRGYANDLAISPDGSTIAVSGSLGIWLVDAATLEPLRLLEGHAGLALSVDWSPDGTRLVSGGEDGTLRTWDAASGKCLFAHHPDRSMYGMSVAWSPDGRWVASRHEAGLFVWDALNGELARTMQASVLITQQYGRGVAWSPDSSRLATLDEQGQLQVWEVKSEQLLYEVNPGGKLTGYGVAWSADGRWIATTQRGSASDGVTGILFIYNAANGVRMRSISQPYGNFTSLSWSPDGAHMVTPGDVNSISVWDTANGSQSLRLDGSAARVIAVDWSPDGGWLVSIGVDGSLRTWDTATGELRQTAGRLFLGAVTSVDWSPDGSRLASGGEDETVRLWEMTQSAGGAIQDSAILTGPISYVNAVTWLVDGTTLLAGGGEDNLYAWDASGRQTDVFPVGGIEEIACSPAGDQCVMSGLGTGRIEFIDLNTGAATELEGFYASPNSIAWSPDGRWIAFGGSEMSVTSQPDRQPGVLRLWDTLDRSEVVLPCNSRVIFSVAWSPDGKRLAAGGYSYEGAGSNLLHVWNVPQGNAAWEAPTELGGSAAWMKALAWSPSGELLAGGDIGGAVVLWSPEVSQQPLRLMGGHTAGVRSLDWSPDGQRFATGGEDGTIRIWGVPLNEPVHTIMIPTEQPATTPLPGSAAPITAGNAAEISSLASLGRGTVRDMALSPDDRLMAVASGSRVWLYDPHTWRLLFSLPFPNNGEVTGIAWSPDGSKLAATGETHRVWLQIDIVRTAVWDTATWEIQAVLGAPRDGISISARAVSLAFSADSQWLLTPYGYELIEWNLYTAQSRREMNTESVKWPNVYNLTLSTTGDRAVVSGGTFEDDGILILWDMVASQILDSAVTCTADILSIELSPDGKRLAVVCPREGLQIWRLEGDKLNKEEQFVSPEAYLALDAAWSPDGSQVLLSGSIDNPDGNGTIGQLWVLDAANGQAQQTYTPHISPVSAVVWLPGGKQFAAASEDGGLSVFDVSTLSHQPITDNRFSNDELISLAWMPDSKQLATVSSYGAARVWNIDDSTIDSIQQAYLIAIGDTTNLYAAAISPDGRYLATGAADNGFKVTELASGKLVREFYVESGASYTGLAWSPDGTYLAGSSYEEIQVWELQSGERCLDLSLPEVWPKNLAWSPDGSRLAASEYLSAGGYIRIWDVGSALAAGAANAPQVSRIAAHDEINAVAWSPDGSYLAVGGYNDMMGSTPWLRISVFNRNGGRMKDLEIDTYWGAVTSLAWSPDGTLLAAGGGAGGFVVWDASSWEMVSAFYYAHAPHQSVWRGVTALAWSPDGTLLASAGGDGMVRLWGVP